MRVLAFATLIRRMSSVSFVFDPVLVTFLAMLFCEEFMPRRKIYAEES
jgi:hypothetical protein